MYQIIGIDGRHYGPVTAEQVKRWVAENRLHSQTLARLEGTQDWKPLSTFPEFAGDFQAPPPLSAAAPPVAAPNPKAGNKLAAGICGILLGSFGVHKFILGYTGAGLIMLLVTILTCFMALPVMHLIGLIEGILYLTKSDEEFVRTYVDQRREWF